MRNARSVVTVALVGLALVALGGCGLAAPAASTLPTPLATAGPTVGPSASPTPPPTATPPATPAPSQGPSATPPASDGPPQASVSVDSQATAVGWLGSYCWLGTCADTFELPPKASLPAVMAGATAALRFSLDSNAGFTSWSAAYTDASMDGLAQLSAGGQPFDPDASASPPPMLTEASFTAPPAGDWVLVVEMHAIDGDAQYAWHLTVE